jgi:hypothetical protein
MKRVFAVCLLLSLGAGAAAQAQLATTPMWFSPAFGSGVGVFATWGMGVNDDAKFSGAADASSPMAFGGTIHLGVSAFKANVTANYVDTKVDGLDNEMTYGGNLGVALYQGGPETPVYVDIMVGFGYAKFGEGAFEEKYTNIPVSIPLSYGAQLSGGSTIEVWMAPRVIFWSWSVGGGESTSDIGFGGGLGLNYYSAMGLGVYINGDWTTTKFGEGTVPNHQPIRLGAGLGWRFSVPSFSASKGLIGG